MTTLNPETLFESEASGYVCSVAGRDHRGVYTDENPAAHGNVTIRETDPITGIWRAVNINGFHREEGPWQKTINNAAKIKSLTRQIEALAKDISADIQRGAKDGLTGNVTPKICREIIAADWRKFDYLSKTADKMEEYAEIENEIKALKKAEGSRPIQPG